MKNNPSGDSAECPTATLSIVISLMILAIVVTVGLLSIYLDGISDLDVDNSQAEYHCPLHPEQTYDTPGFCPICGAALVKSSPEIKNSDP